MTAYGIHLVDERDPTRSKCGNRLDLFKSDLQGRCAACHGSDDRHDCPAAGCPRRIPFEQMACRLHWFALPPDLRRRVGRAWRSGDTSAILAVRREVVATLAATVPHG